jgi:hypothetical protein
MRFTDELTHAGLIKKRRDASRCNENRDPIPQDQSFRMIDLDAVTIDQGHCERLEWRSALERP